MKTKTKIIDQTKKEQLLLKNQNSRPICQICYEQREIYSNLEMIKCQKCEKNVHKLCYNPQLTLNKEQKQFLCDYCSFKVKSRRDIKCSICRHGKGILKRITTFNQNGEQLYSWVHVVCGLFSFECRIKSFSSLQFQLKDENRNFNQRSILDLKDNKVHKCLICSSKLKTSNLLKCAVRDCQNMICPYCLYYLKTTQKQNWQQIFLLLEKNNFVNRNMKQFSSVVSYLPFPPLQKLQEAQYKYVVCLSHNENEQNIDFNYCPCELPKKDQLVGCDFCYRWLHLSCSDYKSSKDQLRCNGCKKVKHSYQKNMCLSEIIQIGFQIEQSKNKQFELKQLDRLNLFPFELSEVILTKMRICKEQVYNYYTNIYLKRLIIKISDLTTNPKTAFQYTQRIQVKQWFGKLTNNNNILNNFDEYQCKKVIREIDNCQLLLPTPKKLIAQIINCRMKFQKQNQQKTQKNKDKQEEIKQEKKLQKKQQPDKLNLKCDLFQKIKMFQKKIGNKCISQIVNQLYQLSNLYKNQQKNTVNKLNKKQLLGVILQSNLQKEFIGKVLLFQSTFCQYLQLKSQFIPQNLYFQYKRFINEIPLSSQQILTKYFNEKYLDNYVINHQIKEQHKIFSKVNEIYQAPKIKMKTIESIVAFLSLKDVVLPMTEQLIKIDTQIILAKAVKKIYSQSLLNQQNFQDQKFQKISKFFQQSKIIILSDNEKLRIPTRKIKRQFYKNIKEKYQTLTTKSAGSPFSRDQSSIQNFKRQEIQQILSYDQLKKLSISFLISIMEPLVKNNIELEKFQKDLIGQFVENLLNNKEFLKIKKSITPKTLKGVIEIINYVDIIEKFPTYSQVYFYYLEWIQPLKSKKPIERYLQKQNQCSKILQIINVLLNTSQNIDLNIQQQLKKLKTISLWCNISLKYFKISHTRRSKKPTIFTIQCFREIINNSNYPDNQIQKLVQELHRESIETNRKISRFIQKNSYKQLQIFEEIKLYKNKITLKEAEELVKELKNSKFDVSAQLGQLQHQISQFKKIQSNQTNQLHDLNKLTILKKKIIQSSIRANQENKFVQFVSRYYSLKAENMQYPISRKQFMKVLNSGSIGSVKLLESEKGNKIHRIFKAIERAEKQLLQQNKPQKNLLLLSDESKYLQEKDIEQSERKIWAKWFTKAKNLKQKFKRLKAKRDYQREFFILKEQIGRIPINLRQILQEIAEMKQEISTIEIKLRNQSIQSQIFSNFSEQLLTKYKKISMKNQNIEKIAQKYNIGRRLLKFSQNFKLQNYKLFSIECQKDQQVSQLDKVKRLRQQYFQTVFNRLISGQIELNKEIQLTIIKEGCQMVKNSQNMYRRQQILKKILEVNSINEQMSDESYEDRPEQFSNNDQIDCQKRIHSGQQDCEMMSVQDLNIKNQQAKANLNQEFKISLHKN